MISSLVKLGSPVIEGLAHANNYKAVLDQMFACKSGIAGSCELLWGWFLWNLHQNQGVSLQAHISQRKPCVVTAPIVM